MPVVGLSAQTTAMSATEPLVIHILVPFSTQSSPSRLARVRMPAGLEPKSGLGQPEAADRLAGRHPRQPGLLLLLAAELPDREHGQRALHRHHAAHAGVAGLQLQAGQPVRDGVGARAAVARPGACRAGRARRPRASAPRSSSPRSYQSAMFGRTRRSTNVADAGLDVPLLVGQQVVDAEQLRAVRLPVIDLFLPGQRRWRPSRSRPHSTARARPPARAGRSCPALATRSDRAREPGLDQRGDHALADAAGAPGLVDHQHPPGPPHGRRADRPPAAGPASAGPAPRPRSRCSASRRATRRLIGTPLPKVMMVRCGCRSAG